MDTFEGDAVLVDEACAAEGEVCEDVEGELPNAKVFEVVICAGADEPTACIPLLEFTNVWCVLGFEYELTAPLLRSEAIHPGTWFSPVAA